MDGATELREHCHTVYAVCRTFCADNFLTDFSRGLADFEALPASHVLMAAEWVARLERIADAFRAQAKAMMDEMDRLIEADRLALALTCAQAALAIGNVERLTRQLARHSLSPTSGEN